MTRLPVSGLDVCPDCGEISFVIVPTIEGDAFQCGKCGLRWYWNLRAEPELVKVKP